MADDPRDKPRRAGTYQGDVERIGRRRTPAMGYPTYVDPELTPPPQEQPRPSSRDGYDTIAPAVRQQLDALADGLGTLTVAVGKVWDARKDVERLDRIEQKIGTIADIVTRHDATLSELVVPGIKDTIAAVDGVERQLPRLIGQVEAMTNVVSNVDKRVRDLELDVRSLSERFNSSNQATQARLGAVESIMNSHDVRIIAIERSRRDETVAVVAISKSDKRRLAVLVAVVGVGSSAATFIATHLSWFAHLFQ